MKVFKSGIILTVLMATSPAFATRAPQAAGGHDGSGSRLLTSTPEQVHAAIDWAINSVLNDRDPDWNTPQTWLFWSMPFGPEIPDGNGGTVSAIQCLAQPMVCTKLTPQLPEDKWGLPVIRNSAQILKPSRIRYEERGPCPAEDKSDAVASVSERKIGAEICFSMPLLEKIPPAALRSQVAGIVAHEMIHLLGWGEGLATQVQNGISGNFAKISRADGDQLRHKAIAGLMESEGLLKVAGTSDIPAFWLGRASGFDRQVVGMLPDGINDRTIPVAKPELSKAAMEAVTNVAVEIEGVWMNAKNMSPEQIQNAVQDLQAKHRAAFAIVEEFIGVHVSHF